MTDIETPSQASAGSGKTMEGSGKTLDDAVKDAVSKIPTSPGADNLVVAKVVEWGYKSGGYVGFADFWVTISYREN